MYFLLGANVVGDTYDEEENNVGVEVENIQNGVDLTADSALKDQANEVQTAAASQPVQQVAAATSDDDDDDDEDDDDDVTDFEEGKHF